VTFTLEEPEDSLFPKVCESKSVCVCERERERERERESERERPMRDLAV
jgi:hypothetical protein